MKNLPLILLLCLSPIFISITNPSSANNSIKNEKSLVYQSSQEKKEVITHIIANEDCSLNGISLYGKVKIVDAFPDLKIQFVNAFPDIKVKWVEAFPNECGKWQKVDAFPDFKIQIVDAFPDLKVQVVNAFPGMNQ
jgi:hypothetical protein